LNKDQLENLSKEVDLERILQFLKQQKVVEPKASWEKIPFYKPKPAKDCEDGYSDRIGIHEILKINESTKNLIMANTTSDDIEKQAKKEGMMTMLEDGIIKAVQGITTIEEVLRVTRE